MKPFNSKILFVQTVTRRVNVSSFVNVNTFCAPTASVDRGYVSSVRVKNKIGVQQMKAKVIIPLSNSGILSAHGYEDVREKSELARHRALMRVVRAGEPPLGLFRRLNVLMILFKNKDPKLSKIFKKDRDWVKEKLL